MFIVKHKNFFFIISGIIVVLSLFFIFSWGLHFGIEYKGGTIAEFVFPSGRQSDEIIKDKIESLNFGQYTYQPTGENGVILKTRYLSETERVLLFNSVSDNNNIKVEEKRFNSIGPVIGSELKQKALIALILIVLCVIFFITFAFRKVSKPVASWKYGLVAIVALFHDIIIPSGVFAFLIKFRGAEIDILFTTALLAIFGLSISDTIVVFDRIRENLRRNENKGKGAKEDFDIIVGNSISQTYVRSFNTSFTVILVLLALFFWGGESTKNFSLILLVGMIAGTYSSIILASPMLVVLNNWQKKKLAKVKNN